MMMTTNVTSAAQAITAHPTVGGWVVAGDDEIKTSPFEFNVE